MSVEPRRRWQDLFDRFLGARDMHWQLVAQAGLEPHATVLEIGCGSGNVLMLATRVVPSATVIGIDPDPEALALARAKAAAAGVQVRLDEGSAQQLPYPDGSVDRVLSSLMLHHVPADEQLAALREARRVLAPGGRLHLLDFDHDPRTSSPLGKLLGRLHRHGDGHSEGQGHGHSTTPAPELLAAAGFTEILATGRGRSLLGPYTFYRAVSPGPPGTSGAAPGPVRR